MRFLEQSPPHVTEKAGHDNTSNCCLQRSCQLTEAVQTIAGNVPCLLYFRSCNQPSPRQGSYFCLRVRNRLGCCVSPPERADCSSRIGTTQCATQRCAKEAMSRAFDLLQILLAIVCKSVDTKSQAAGVVMQRAAPQHSKREVRAASALSQHRRTSPLSLALQRRI